MFNINIPDKKSISLSTIFTVYENSSSPSYCSCQDTSQCNNQTKIYTTPTGNTIQYSIPGLYFGCFMIEALLQSNLICFYSQSCIDDLRYALNSSSSNLNLIALDQTIPSRYEIDTAINDILSEMMDEQ